MLYRMLTHPAGPFYPPSLVILHLYFLVFVLWTPVAPCTPTKSCAVSSLSSHKLSEQRSMTNDVTSQENSDDVIY
eukprot:scaffold4432_cov76-Cyclotella_meneghiniana.AAC.13